MSEWNEKSANTRQYKYVKYPHEKSLNQGKHAYNIHKDR